MFNSIDDDTLHDTNNVIFYNFNDLFFFFYASKFHILTEIGNINRLHMCV